jgi:hypothetical protein
MLILSAILNVQSGLVLCEDHVHLCISGTPEQILLLKLTGSQMPFKVLLKLYFLYTPILNYTSTVAILTLMTGAKLKTKT